MSHAPISSDLDKSEAAFKAMSVGQRLKWMLEHRGVKQLHLAQKLGIMQSTISNIVTDASRRPSAPTLMMLATELQCNPTWLLDGEGNPFSWAPVTSDDQVDLLNAWKAMTPQSRAVLLAMARQLVPPH